MQGTGVRMNFISIVKCLKLRKNEKKIKNIHKKMMKELKQNT